MSEPVLPLLIEPETLEQHLDNPDLLILDVSSATSYAQGHVPGAIHLPPQYLVSGVQPATGKLPPIKQLKAVFSHVGLEPGKHVVAYDDEGGGWAGRLIWTLDVLGHRQYSYLNGGIHAWRNEGHPVETIPRQGRASDYEVLINPEPIIEAEEIMRRLEDANMGIWDARGTDEYAGFKAVARRSGHIPGAANLDWLELMDRSRNLRLRDLDEIQAMLDDRGLTKDKEIVTHCQTHHRSGLSYLVGKLLGYTIRGYHGSWSEWGNRDDTPIETL
jgi:thiosulfate/3-mercaptopyruvate sulfurtransferase